MSTRKTKEPVVKELELIRQELQALSLRVDRLAEAIDADTASFGQDFEWEVVEGEQEVSPDLALNLKFRTVEDGPLPPQVELVRLVESILKSSAVPAKDRLTRALKAGHWAWAAWQTDTSYVPEGSIAGLASNHFVVVRAAGHSEPFRVSSRRELHKFVDLSSSWTIVEEFPSLTEVQIFCSVLQIKVPACRRSRKPASGMQPSGSQGY